MEGKQSPVPFSQGTDSNPQDFRESQRADSKNCLSGKGGKAKKLEEQPGGNRATLEEDPGSASRDTCNSISIQLKPPVEWKMSSFFIPDQRKQRSSSRRPPKARLKEPQTFIRLPKTRLKEYSPCTYTNLISNLTLQLLL